MLGEKNSGNEGTDKTLLPKLPSVVVLLSKASSTGTLHGTRDQQDKRVTSLPPARSYSDERGTRVKILRPSTSRNFSSWTAIKWHLLLDEHNCALSLCSL